MKREWMCVLLLALAGSAHAEDKRVAASYTNDDLARVAPLRAETGVTLKWIAETLHMGTWTHVANRLYHCP